MNMACACGVWMRCGCSVGMMCVNVVLGYGM